MRETNFIQQNKKKWKELESTMSKERKDPDKLKSLFVQITDDLSYSRTFYPNRSVRVYLNTLAQQVYYKIYKNKRSNRNRFLHFWSDELPYLVYQSKTAFLLSFGLFILAFAIGALSSAMDVEFPRIILGDQYVDMTLENIASGDPMAVYKQKGAFDMSLGITINNMLVALRTFVLGVFFAIGTVGILIYNGIMVGAFQYFFYEKGVFWESFLTIWTHGTLEISAIIIAGAAGLTMGSGLVFPGTYSRMQSFLVSARRGLKIMVGIAPIIIMAGFIEGYLTRYTETPDAIRFAFILLCLFSVLGYFVWYPFFHKKTVGFNVKPEGHKLAADGNYKIQFGTIKTTDRFFTDSFAIYKKQLAAIFKFSTIISGIGAILIYFSYGDSLSESFQFPANAMVFFSDPGTFIGQFFNYEKHPLLYPIQFILFGSMAYFSLGWMGKIKGKPSSKSTVMQILGIAVILGVLHFFFFSEASPSIIVFLLFLLITLWLPIFYFEQKNGFTSIGRTFNLLSGQFGTWLTFNFIVWLISLFFFGLIFSPFFYFYFEILSWNFQLDEVSAQVFLVTSLSFTILFSIGIILPLYFFGGVLLYDSLLEIKDAKNLLSQIKLIGESRKIRGLEKE